MSDPTFAQDFGPDGRHVPPGSSSGFHGGFISPPHAECTIGAMKGDLVKSSVSNLLKGLAVAVLGVTIGVAGITVGEADDAPGAALIGILVTIGMVVFAVRIARRKT
jgi:cation transporter-like permease